jgi:hypothetical protein
VGVSLLTAPRQRAFTGSADERATGCDCAEHISPWPGLRGCHAMRRLNGPAMVSALTVRDAGNMGAPVLFGRGMMVLAGPLGQVRPGSLGVQHGTAIRSSFLGACRGWCGCVAARGPEGHSSDDTSVWAYEVVANT